jgi:hypothetical protein
LTTRRTRAGQSIILVAVAMVALVAFVGIATDVALLFVRYTALRRAVDSAAIAVAGQVRTGVDFAKLNNIARQFVQLQGGIDPDTIRVETCETDIADYATEYRTLKGLAPTDPIPPDAIDTAEGRTFFDPLNHVIRGVGDLYTAQPGYPKSELCKFDPQKLVRVSAQMDSDTAFLVIVGWRSVTLVASTVSQTAALDVALLIDNSPSMADDTIAAQESYPCSVPSWLPAEYASAASQLNPSTLCSSLYNGRLVSSPTNQGLFRTNYFQLLDFKPFTASPTNGGLGLRPAMPIQLPSSAELTHLINLPDNKLSPKYRTLNPDGTAVTPEIEPTNMLVYRDAHYNNRPSVTVQDIANPSDQQPALVVRAECMYNIEFLKRGWDNGIAGVAGEKSGIRAANYGWGGCCNDPTVQRNPDPTNATEKAYLKYPDAAVPTNYFANPAVGAAQLAAKAAFDWEVNPDWYVFDDGTGIESKIQTNTIIRSMDYVTYDYNADGQIRNNGDGNFSDLVCQPFKQVRDAARRFIRRLDFIRGDRLAIITFSENAELVCGTYNYEYRSPNYNVTDKCNDDDPFIYDKDRAVRTLNFKVGLSHNWGKSAGWQTQCRTGVRRYSPAAGPNAARRGLTYWASAQCPNTNTGGAIFLARSVLKGNFVRREAVWVTVMLSDGYPNRTPGLGTFDVLGRRPDQPVRNWLEVPEEWKPSSFTNQQLDMYCNYYNLKANRLLEDPLVATTPLSIATDYDIVTDNDPPPTNFPIGCDYNDAGNRERLVAFFGPDNPVTTDVNETLLHCNLYGARPELCPKWYPGGPNATVAVELENKRNYSYGYCPWSTFCLAPDHASAYDTSVGLPDAVVMKAECYINPVVNSYGNVIAGVPDIEQKAAWTISGSSVPVAPVCLDNDPDSRHFCSNKEGWINAYDDDSNNNGEPDAGDSAPSNCSKYYDADDYARDQADWAGLLQYTDRTPGDFIAMFGIFFGKKDSAGQEKVLGENILGVKFMRYMSDAGDNGRIDSNLQEWYRHFRAQPDIRTFGYAQGVIRSRPGYPYDHYLSGAAIYEIYKNDGWMDPDQDECAQWDYNEYQLIAGGYRSTYPATAITDPYEQNARKDCGQFWFANDISKVNRAFTEIAGRLFTRLAR